MLYYWWLKPCVSGKTFFNIAANTHPTCIGFEADTSEKLQKHAKLIRLSDEIVNNF